MFDSAPREDLCTIILQQRKRIKDLIQLQKAINDLCGTVEAHAESELRSAVWEADRFKEAFERMRDLYEMERYKNAVLTGKTFDA